MSTMSKLLQNEVESTDKRRIMRASLHDKVAYIHVLPTRTHSLFSINIGYIYTQQVEKICSEKQFEQKRERDIHIFIS